MALLFTDPDIHTPLAPYSPRATQGHNTPTSSLIAKIGSMHLSSLRSSACAPIKGARNNGVASVRPSVVRTQTTPKALFAGFTALFEKKEKALQKVVKRPTVIPSPSFNLPIALFAIAGAEFAADLTPLAAFTGVLGVCLWRSGPGGSDHEFVFDDEGLEVVTTSDLENPTENRFVGGASKWSYDSFVNWELWWPGFPVLTYFKETQTKPEGQIHFFPVIFNGKELYDVMVERCGPSATSGPKDE
eukprot:gene18343-24808_t